MKTIVISFGDGRLLESAQAAVKRFSELNDVEGLVLNIHKLPNELSHPAWAKSCLWEQVPASVERVIWIDADIVPIRPIMDIIPDFEIPFCAVLDAPLAVQQAEWGDEPVRDLSSYFNSGMFVAHRSTEPMFKEWQSQAAKPDASPFWDQTPLNLLLPKYLKPGEIFALPQECNWVRGFGEIPPDVRMAHFAGWPSAWRNDVLRVFALLESEPVQGDRTERGALCIENW